MGSEGLLDRLLPGEHVLWSGRPRQGLMLCSQDLMLVPFSLIWGGFVLFVSIGAIQDARNVGLVQFLLAFLLVFGVYLIFGRFLVDAWMRSHLYYAVTDRRVLILRAGPLGKFTSMPIAQLPPIDLTEGRGGRGTIYFGPRYPWVRQGFIMPASTAIPQFVGIDSARSVYDTIQQQQNAPA